MNKRLLFRGRSKLDTTQAGDRVSALELSLGVAEKQRTSSLNTAFSSALHVHEGKRLDLHEPPFEILATMIHDLRKSKPTLRSSTRLLHALRKSNRSSKKGACKTATHITDVKTD